MFPAHEVPQMFTLAWEPHIPALSLSIRKEVIERAEGYTQRFTELYAELFEKKAIDPKSRSFLSLKEKKCGFGGCVRRVGEASGYITYRLPLPRARVVTKATCAMCAGSGVEHGRDCFSCEGTGRILEYHWDTLTLWGATFAILCRLPSLVEEGSLSSNLTQLLHIRTEVVDRSVYGAPIQAGFSPSAAKWLEGHGDDRLAEDVRGAMNRAFRHLWGFKNAQLMRLSISGDFSRGYVILGACGASLGTDGSADAGFHLLVPHNTDSVRDQIVLICALAVLCEAVEKGLRGT